MIVLRPGASKLRIDELAFSPDGTAIAAPGGHHGVMLWGRLADAAKSDVIEVPIPGVARLAFAPDGRTLYAGNDRLVAIDLADREAVQLDIPAWSSLSFGVSPDSSRLCVAENPRGTEETRLTIWDTNSLEKPAHEVISQSMAYSPPLFSPAGDRFILMEANRQPSRQWETRRVVRSLASGAILERSAPLVDHPEQTVRTADGETLACRTREVIRIYPADGAWTAVPRITNDSKKHFTGIAFHPSGRYLAATSNDATVKLYDTATWEVARTFTWEVGKVRSVAFSPDGTLAAAGSDTGKVVVWDVDV